MARNFISTCLFRLIAGLVLVGAAIPLHADKLCIVDNIQYYIVEPADAEPYAEVVRRTEPTYNRVNLVIPAKITTDGITYRVSKVRKAAFLDCMFSTIDIADGVSIDENAFYQAAATTINIGTSNPPDDAPPSYIGHKAFYNLYGDCKITLGNRVDSIGEYAFQANLEHSDRWGYSYYKVNVTLSPSVRTIGDHAFNICSVDTRPLSSKLEHIGTDVFPQHGLEVWAGDFNVAFIPPGVKSLGNNIFNIYDIRYFRQGVIPCPEHLRKQFLTNNTILEDAVFFYPDDAILEDANIYSPDKSTIYFCADVIPFKSKYTVPEHITCIGDSAYAGGEITNLVIGPQVKSVGRAAFKDALTYCNSTSGTGYLFPTLDIQGLMTEIGPYAFYNTWEHPSSWEGSRVGEYDCNIKLSTTVTTIGEYAFYGQWFRQVFLPESVRNVEEGAFLSPNLARVIYRKGYDYDPTRFGRWREVSEIKAHPEKAAYPILFDPDRMTLTDDGYLFSTQGDTIFAAPSLTEPSQLPSGLKAFAPYSMALSRDNTYNIPPTVTYIGEGAFYSAQKAKVLDLKARAHIARKAFADNINLVKADISRATAVEPDAFAGDIKLDTVVIGYPLPEFSGMVFTDCAAIKRVEYHTKTPQATVVDLFPQSVYSKATLYVPSGTKTAMQNTIPWGLFRNIVEDKNISGIDDLLVTDDYDTNAPVSVYDLRGICVGHSTDNLPAGIYLVRQGSRTDKLIIP